MDQCFVVQTEKVWYEEDSVKVCVASECVCNSMTEMTLVAAGETLHTRA